MHCAYFQFSSSEVDFLLCCLQRARDVAADSGDDCSAYEVLIEEFYSAKFESHDYLDHIIKFWRCFNEPCLPRS